MTRKSNDIKRCYVYSMVGDKQTYAILFPFRDKIVMHYKTKCTLIDYEREFEDAEKAYFALLAAHRLDNK